MRIGMDSSIATCRCSGYMVMDFKKKDLIKDGKLDKDVRATFSVSNPDAWNDSGKPMIGMRDLWQLAPSEYSWNELMKLIAKTERRGCVASCCDWYNCSPNFDNPTEYDMLHLASDIHVCWSLDS